MFHRALIALFLLTLCTGAHAQIVTCTDAIVGQQGLATCTHAENSTAPVGSTIELWCAAATGTPDTTLASCKTLTWQTDSYMQPYSWIWTVQGWQQHGSLSFPVTPSPPPVPPVVTGTGSVVIAWVAPVTNSDGSALTDLAGYRIYSGTSPASLSQFLSITNPAASGSTILGLATGTWYFAVSAFNTAGAEGVMSGVVSKAITATSPPPPPPPADCAMSDWSTWAGGPWSACANGSQMRSEMRTRTVMISPANGGAACPALLETRTATQACGPAWKVAPNGASTVRPLYEAILPVSGATLLRGNQEGAVTIGKPCGLEIFRTGTNSYRSVADADASLSSPTYLGRKHVAICVVSP